MDDVIFVKGEQKSERQQKIEALVAEALQLNPDLAEDREKERLIREQIATLMDGDAR